jgi:hypothetical protein
MLNFGKLILKEDATPFLPLVSVHGTLSPSHDATVFADPSSLNIPRTTNS